MFIDKIMHQFISILYTIINNYLNFSNIILFIQAQTNEHLRNEKPQKGLECGIHT